MPRYELALILKAMRRPETAAALKRTIESLMDRGAIVRNLENLGERALPYRISSHSQQHSRGGDSARTSLFVGEGLMESHIAEGATGGGVLSTLSKKGEHLPEA
uniref:mitochondrial ribosomal protein S6 isoform 3 n=2 Tax=Rattus norvegicus TaxID=10116 RepID=UPI003B9EA023